MKPMSTTQDTETATFIGGSDKKCSVKFANSVSSRSCLQCGKEFKPHRERDRRRERHGLFCSRSCSARATYAKSLALYPQKGDGNWNYRGGRSARPYQSYVKRYKTANPEKIQAHRAVEAALRKGTLVRPEFCDSCFLKRKIDAHHEDHSKPLDVQWLCRKCHIARDKQLAEERLRRVG